MHAVILKPLPGVTACGALQIDVLKWTTSDGLWSSHHLNAKFWIRLCYFTLLVGELPETWTAPEIYLTEISNPTASSKPTTKSPRNPSRFSVSAVSLASKQHLRSSGGTRTQRSENSIEVFAEHRMVADLQTRCIHLGRCGRLMACRLKFGTSFISFIWIFEEQLHASKLQRPPGLCRIGMAIWVLHSWSLLHVNE